jgi:beta-lactamase class A
VRVYVDGSLEGSRDVTGTGTFSFALELPARDVRIRVVAEDAAGTRAASSVSPVFGLPGASRPFPSRPPVLDSALQRRVRALVRAYPGIAAAYVEDLRSGRGAAWNARARFPAASTVKLAIAVEVLRRYGQQPAPHSILYRTLRRMLVDSDNDAANELLVWLGGSTSGGAAMVNALLRSLRITDTIMYGGYETLAAAVRRRPIPLRVDRQPSFGLGKYTTAWDLAQLHRNVYLAARGLGRLPRLPGSFGRRDARYLLWLLAHVADRRKLDRFLPAGARVLHKAGWIADARHDAGVVYWGGGAYVVAVMTWRAAEVGQSSDVLAGRIARAALDRFRRLHAAVGGPGGSGLV